jgi:AcrR family transcriptional regulator
VSPTSGRGGDDVGGGVDDDVIFSATTEKQRRILVAAADVFAERGFAGTPTAEIAKRAGVAEGTIFKHYKTKKELLIGVVGPLLFRFVAPRQMEPVRQIFAHPHERFEDLVRALYRDRLDFLRSHANIVRIFAQEVAFHPELRALAEEALGRTLLKDATAAIERFQAKGEVVAGTPTSILRLMIGTMASYGLLRFVVSPNAGWDDDEEVALMIRFVTAGLKPAPPAPR